MGMTYSCQVAFGGLTPINLQMMDNQIDQVSITGGSDGYDQPQPTVANLQFLNPVFDGVQLLPAQIVGQPIRIVTSYDYNGSSYSNNFYGVVMSAEMMALDSTATNNIMSITAMSLMGLYSRKYANRAGYSAQSESARMTAIGTDLAQWWEDVNASITWDDYPSTLDWQNVDDNPWGYTWGVFFAGSARNLIATTALPTDALSYLQTLADGASAWTWDAGLSGIGYAPLQYWAGTTAVTVDAESSVIFNALETNVDVADRYNSAYVTNGTLSASSASVPDIVANGEYAMSIDSDLANQLDLQNTATFKLAGHGLGVRPLTQITVDLDTLTDSTVAAQLGLIRVPLNINLNNMPDIYMPTGLNPEKWQARGGTLSLSAKHAEVTLNIVPFAVYYTGTVTWNSVSSSDAWNTYATAITTWADVA